MSHEENWKDVVIIDQSGNSVLPVDYRPRVKSWMNAHTFNEPGERNVMASLTVPDMSLSVQQIIDRQSQGLPVTGRKIPEFDPNDTLPDMRTLDLAEIAELKAKYRQEYLDIQESVKLEKEAKKASKAKAERERMEEYFRSRMEADKSASSSTNNP